MAIDPKYPDDRPTTVRTETVRTDSAYVEPRRESGIGRVLLLALVAALVLGLIAWATGLINLDASGKLETPQVKVEGGEIPKVQVETADVNIGEKKVTVDVPTISVDKPGDDGSANK